MAIHTFDELSDDELDQIESRAAAATVGPWLGESADADLPANVSVIELGLCNEVGTFRSIELVGASAADHEFIVNARQDIPKLLYEVRCLRARLQSLIAGEIEPHTIRAGAEDVLLMSSRM